MTDGDRERDRDQGQDQGDERERQLALQLDPQRNHVDPAGRQFRDVAVQLLVVHPFRVRPLGGERLRRGDRQPALRVGLEFAGFAVGPEVADPHVAAPPRLFVNRGPGEQPLRQTPFPLGESIRRQGVHGLPVGVEMRVVIDGAVVAHEPASLQDVDVVARPAADDAAQVFGLAVRVGQEALAHAEQGGAPQQREEHERQRDPVQTDAARLHHRELARPPEQPDRHQGGDQRRDGQDVVDELRRGVPEVLQDDVQRRVASEQPVRYLEERRQVEDAEQPDERQQHQLEVLSADVAIQQARPPADPAPDPRTRSASRRCGGRRDRAGGKGGSLRRRRPPPEVGQRGQQAVFAEPRPPVQQHEAEGTQHEIADPHRPMGRHQAALGQRLAAEHQHVVGEDDADAQPEAGELAVLAGGHAEREADEREHEARDGQREPLVDLHDLVVRRESAGLHLGRFRPQLGERHFPQAAPRTVGGEDVFGIETQQHLVEPVDVVGRRV